MTLFIASVFLCFLFLLILHGEDEKCVTIYHSVYLYIKVILREEYSMKGEQFIDQREM